ncbi:MFS siderochrome iron transporter 1 [Recurvomyces mirabilis]|uniref:MFS siderochrome iron transporter 1 n=1 Tax=Recurvomyces mirabilis TaxID=574656 RepID=A0AAE0WKF9_9PEZI|nr:MFS siderochrome iron transporter 1 [Recurvomyces mirabilis]KAK5153118.1 MFS siderochrome iron transporter 1 [Recurvomyces mirabilis]
MPFLSRIRSPVEVPVAAEEPTDNKNATAVESQDAASDSDGESLSKDAQHGVQKMEATTSVWSRNHLIAAYVLIWVIYSVDTMQQSMSDSLTPYVTSAFQEHSLTATTSIMSSIIGGLLKLPLAKILDIWGRPQGFALMVCCLTLGLIMMAGCNNVQTYAAAQVFYWVGYNGLDYSLSIFIADTSSLKNRSFMFAYATSPHIITSWIGGPLATAFLNGAGFRWGFGTFAIVTPIVCSPLFFLFIWNYRKAKKAGLTPISEHRRSSGQSLWHYVLEFDLAGLLLLCGGLALFLLPFSLYSYQTKGWQSPMIICMIAFGGLLLIRFALYEKYIAPKTFIPFSLLTDRTVLGANILAATLFVTFYIWNSYFQSFLQVVNGLTITEASYVGQIYTIGSCFWAIVVGLAIKWTGRFKWIALYFGVPMQILGVALMIKFRQPGVKIGYVVMCQIFIALSGGALVICEQMAVMAATTHQFVAVVLALEGMFASVGGAIGSTVAAAIWTGVFPQQLQQYLPENEKADYLTIYASLETQLSYEVGTPARNAINRAYGDSQRYMLIAATAILVLAVVSTAVWRDIKVKDFKQAKGRVV